MVPLKVDTVPTRFPLVTFAFIGLCIGTFMLRGHLAGYGNGFVPVDFMYALLHPGKQTGAIAVTLLVSFFLHAGWVHLLSNMWYLWTFGSALEYTVSRRAFVLVYVACGILSMVIQASSTPLSTIPVVGASGAIAGVMGAYLVLLPFSRIVLWFPPVFFFRIPAFLFLLLWFALQYVSMRLASFGEGGVAWWAHLGGYACGFLIALELGRRKRTKSWRRLQARRVRAPSQGRRP